MNSRFREPSRALFEVALIGVDLRRDKPGGNPFSCRGFRNHDGEWRNFIADASGDNSESQSASGANSEEAGALAVPVSVAD
jgi:hypothetical protein